MPATVATSEGTLRQLRIMYGSLIVAAFLYAYIVFKIPVSDRVPPDPVFLEAVAVAAIVNGLPRVLDEGEIFGASI